MKKSWKAGIIISFIGIAISSGCSSTSTSQPKMFTKKAEAASSTASSTNVADGNIEYAFTQADQHPEKVLIKEIDSATSTLDIAIYSLTQPEIVQAILKAEKRGVKVRVITDKIESESKYQKEVIDKLKAAKIPVKGNSHSGLMHLKVSIIDNKTVTTGSFNYTSSASKINDEVLVIIKNNEQMGADFEKQFDRMWNDSKDFSDL